MIAYSGSMRQRSDMNPWISLIPRSVYSPLRHMSHSPTAQLGQGTGSGRRTMPTTRSPFFSPPLGPGSSTRPSDSWPSTRRGWPGGAQPYLPSAISTSVPQTPTATASTRTEPSRTSGSGTSSKRAVPGFPGSTVIAFMLVAPRPSPGTAGASPPTPPCSSGTWNHSSSETGSIPIASVGHPITQTPQPMHLSRSTTDLPGSSSTAWPEAAADAGRFGPSAIASTGQRMMQAPQAVHGSGSMTAR